MTFPRCEITNPTTVTMVVNHIIIFRGTDEIRKINIAVGTNIFIHGDLIKPRTVVLRNKIL